MDTMRKLQILILLTCLTACSEEAPPPAATPVVIADVATRDVPITMELIGTTEGAVDAEIRPQVSGYLIGREYAEGTTVKQGQVLFKVDPRTYRAALEQTRGDLERAQARLAKASQDVERYTPLAERGAVSQQELDDAIQARRAGGAEVQTARAAVDKAEIDLAFTEVRSPIAGIAGVAGAQLGDLVGPSDPEPLTTVSQLDPIRVAFSLSEREYLRFSKAFREAATGAPAREATLDLVLDDGSTWPHRGRAVPAAAGIDPRTGTILIRGEFPNPDGVLRTGQFARVRGVTDVLEGAVVVPQRAIAELQGAHQVAVVDDQNQVSIRIVETGPRFESLQVIVKGLEAGERVVVEGVQKVRNGTLVTPAPEADAEADAESKS
jgi:membrane fusion protein (multidrug efflux system)